ncbi:MAG: efflux RND transporter permease subunit [Marinilabiliaceae bacterium]|nr:efflux RND transporter permease subunit [Marinilabiliaceae bacterium]
MMHLSELVFRKKNIFYFLLVSIIVGGMLSYQNISKLEDPEIVVMMAKVVTIYPGASAHEVEMQVTNVLENEISELADIESIKSQSSANVSVIDVELKMTVPQGEIPQRWEFMRRKVQNAIPKLPEGTQKPMVIDDIGDVYGMFYAMTADGFSYQEMAEQADFIKRGILEVEGVRKVAVYGNQTPTADIVLSVEKMAQMGLFPVQVISAIQQYNLSVYPGVLKTGNQALRVSVSGRINSIEDLKNILVKGLNQELFKLSDFATITQTYNDPLHNTMFLNNQEALGISISMESGENIIELGKRVDEQLTQLKKNIPAGFEFSKVFFQPEKVDNAINNFMRNLIMSVLIVVIVLMLTMGLRSGLIIGGGLLLTILATFPILLMADGTLQRISLGAFIVAMGMLVDNSIVVIDGIMVDLQKGRKNKNTFINSAKRTAMPLLAATVIAVAAFLPAFLSKDTAGTYVHDLFVVLCISLLISWVLSLTQVPLFSALFLKQNKKTAKKNPFEGIMYKVVRKALTFFMKHKIPTIILAVILLCISAYNFKNVKQTFFPDFNYNQAYIEYKLPYGNSPEKVNLDLKEITEHLLSFDEVKMVVTSQGMTPTRYCLVRALGEIADNYGELIVNFEDYETMIRMKPLFEQYLHNNYPDASTRIRKYNLSIKASHTVEAEFSGPDPAILRQLSHQARQIMQNSPYADTYTICDNWEPMGKTLYAQYNQTSASRTGTTRSDISNALLAATDGLPLGYLYEGETPVEIRLKTRNNDGTRIENLNDVPVWNLIPNINPIDKDKITQLITGVTSLQDVTKEIVSSIPLSTVTHDVAMQWEESVVHRVDGKRTIQAQCEPKDGDSPALLRQDIKKAIEAIELPEGYSVKWMGEFELQGTALKNIFSYLPIALMIIILVLIMLFNDFKRPLIVLLCIPLAIIGIVPGLILSGEPFTFIAIIGTLGLMGMLIKNSIVLLDEIHKQIREGKERYHAIINATILRTRPVIMASFTTILGMLPLFTDPMYSSMAVAVISGLLIGTLITLIFVPILYAVFYGVENNEGNTNLKPVA